MQSKTRTHRQQNISGRRNTVGDNGDIFLNYEIKNFQLLFMAMLLIKCEISIKIFLAVQDLKAFISCALILNNYFKIEYRGMDLSD